MKYERLYNVDLEKELCAIFLQGGRDRDFPTCRKIVDAEDFSDSVCRKLWVAFCDLYDMCWPINHVNVHTIAKQKQYDLGEWWKLQSESAFGNIISYSIELHTLASKRRLLVKMQSIAQKIDQHEYGIDDIGSDIIKAIETEKDTALGTIKWQTLNMDVLKHAEKLLANEEEQLGILVGFRYFDARGGLRTGDLDVIAGATSAGKTSLAMSLALGAALRKTPVVIYSIEMSPRDIAFRISSMISGIPAREIERTRLTQQEFDKLYTSLQPRLIAEAPIYFDAARTNNIDRIMMSIRNMVADFGVKVAVVDYAQLLSGKGGERRIVIGNAANALKAMAIELDVVIILLSQLARKPKGSNNLPSLNELKESGELENAADNVYLVYRAEVFHEQYPSNLSHDWSVYDTKGTALIIHAKARNGSIGEFLLGFNGELTKFYDREMYDRCDDNEQYDERTPF